MEDLGENKKILTVKQIAQLHVDNPNNKDKVRTKIKRINELINSNIDSFTKNIDIINLKKCEFNFKDLILNKILSQNSINRSIHIYILSCTGYCKLYNMMRDKNKELKNNILKKYFGIENIFNDDVIYKEIDFKNTYISRINIILNNINNYSWNIDRLTLKNIMKNNYHIPLCQYPIHNNKYRIDFYFDKLKIICEFDEFKHRYQEGQDIKRMNEIIKYLSYKNGDCGYNENNILCDLYDDPIDVNNNDYTIIRIKDNDKNGIDKLIGLVIGKIFSLC